MKINKVLLGMGIVNIVWGLLATSFGLWRVLLSSSGWSYLALGLGILNLIFGCISIPLSIDNEVIE